MPVYDFTYFPVLTTTRLILRELHPEDAPALLALNSDPEVLKYDVDAPLRDLAQAEALISKSKENFQARESISWAISLRDDQRFIGEIVFFFWEKVYYKADLGYRLAPAYWRRGLTSEALRELMRFGFEDMGLHRINVDTRMDNRGSLGLMRTCGFSAEGVRRECVRSEDGSYQDWGLFGMLETEYWALRENK